MKKALSGAPDKQKTVHIIFDKNARLILAAFESYVDAEEHLENQIRPLRPGVEYEVKKVSITPTKSRNCIACGKSFLPKNPAEKVCTKKCGYEVINVNKNTARLTSGNSGNNNR